MQIRPEVNPFLAVVLAVAVLAILAAGLAGLSWTRSSMAGGLFAVIACAYLAYFFRDPDRTSPADPSLIVAAADGVVAKIVEIDEPQYLKAKTVRISIFLSLFDVHVNRSPIEGRSRFLGYFPGRRFFTFQEKSSEFNQHNAILIEGDRTRCLVKQIVGPVCRRVVYWPDPDKAVALQKGDRIGMMKFGSRLDMYFPKDDVEVVAQLGERVQAGVSVIARVKAEGKP